MIKCFVRAVYALFVSDYWNGWACFTVSILVIGMLTALIGNNNSFFEVNCFNFPLGDLASQFGCWVSLKWVSATYQVIRSITICKCRDAVTAISFVALGTSVPGIKQLLFNEKKQKIQIHLLPKFLRFKINMQTYGKICIMESLWILKFRIRLETLQVSSSNNFV